MCKTTLQKSMRKVIIWGLGLDYDFLLNNILYEIKKGSMSVEAVACEEQDKYCAYKDGFPVITKKEINNFLFDYLIVTSSTDFLKIKNDFIKLDIAENKIIDGNKMKLPLFDFALYCSLIENPVTILSDDCWAGYVYNRLGLRFSTPLINIFWDRDEYIRFICDPFFFFDSELQMVRDGNLKKGIYPIGKLGKENNYVILQFVHNMNFAEAKEQWDRRLLRINRNNIFIKMGFGSDLEKEKISHYLDIFSGLNYNKILFYLDEAINITGKFHTDRFIWKQSGGKRVETHDYNDYLRLQYFWDLDILRLLTGHTSYSRYINS